MTDSRALAHPAGTNGRPASEATERDIDPARGSLTGEGSAVSREARATLEASQAGRRTESATAADPSAYFGQPILKEPVWRAYIPLYFFTGGIAGGAAALGAAAQLVAGGSLRSLVMRTRWVTLAAAVASAALLIADLGRPARFLHMMRVFRPTSPMNLGTWVVSGIGASSAAAALLGRSAVGDLAGIASGVFGLPMGAYTAVLLSNTAVPFWAGSRRVLPALFVASAATAAASTVELFELPPREARAARIFGIAGKVGEVVAMVAMRMTFADKPDVARPLGEGQAGNLWRVTRALTAASLAASLWPGRSRGKRTIQALLGLAGAVALRFAVVEAGKASARDPRVGLG